MQLGHIDIQKPEISPANMRRYGRNPDLANILPTVRSRGVIQPLLVRPKAEGYEVVAGGRRYLPGAALRLMVAHVIGGSGLLQVPTASQVARHRRQPRSERNGGSTPGAPRAFWRSRTRVR